MRRFLKIIRNHIVTGFVFFMPVLIALVIISKFWNKLLVLGSKISKLLKIDTVLGTTGDAIVTVILIILICIVAGFLVKLSVFKRMSDALDEALANFIPGYNDLRKTTEKKIGMGPQEEIFETCLVHIQDHWQPAYLVDVKESGEATVYIPIAPTFKTGQVAIVPAEHYKKMKIDSKTLNNYLKEFGRGISIS